MDTTIPKDGPMPLKVAILACPGFTLLDLVGSQAVLGMHAETYLAWKTLDPVPSDSGLSVNPTHTFEQVPDDLGLLVVPGGYTAIPTKGDVEILDFMIRAGASARYVTSVCSGALILGQVGLLDGYRAATHWAGYDVLEAFGVQTDRARVVHDRNRMTGGGVTAGIDFGLTFLAELLGEPVARMTQLALEYDPKPPFDSGHPGKAGPETVAMIRQGMGSRQNEAGIEAARSKRGAPAHA